MVHILCIGFEKLENHFSNNFHLKEIEVQGYILLYGTK